MFEIVKFCLEAGAGGNMKGIQGRIRGIEGKVRNNRGEHEPIGESRRQSGRAGYNWGEQENK